MLVAPELEVLALELTIEGEHGRGELPDNDGLIVGARGHVVGADAHHAHPVSVAVQRAHTVARGHLPDLDGAIARARHHVIAGGRERHRAHVVVVALQGLDARVGVGEVPETYGHVGRARGEQASTRIERHVLDDVGVAFECALKVARFIIPNLEQKKFKINSHLRRRRVQSMFVKAFSFHLSAVVCKNRLKWNLVLLNLAIFTSNSEYSICIFKYMAKKSEFEKIQYNTALSRCPKTHMSERD